MIIFDIETNGLEKRSSRITCISMISINSDKIHTIMNEDEKLLLEEFFRILYTSSEDLLLTFNGNSFDIPFIIHRALVTNTIAPKGFKFPKTIDLRQIATGFFYNYDKYEKGTLNDWCSLLNLECKFSNGKEVAEAWERRDLNFIKEHCEYDVLITKELAKRCLNIGLI